VVAETRDNANVVIRPPIALLLAIAAGLVLDWRYPWPWLPAHLPASWIGAALFAAGLALVIWAIVTFSRAGTQVPTTEPTSTIVGHGPYRFSRNPIYLGMFTGLAGLAVGFNTVWMLAALAAFYLVIRYGVVAREEAYLERKFGDAYLVFKSRVRRWL
jgi:protein-S-isoprenylcysteine O-methyltransferase Ste14